MSLTTQQQRLCEDSRWDFSDLSALYINCTLKKSPQPSHTEGLMRQSMAIMETNGVSVEYIRAVDHDIAPGVYPNMTEYGWEVGRLAGHPEEGDGQSDPGDRLTHLAR